MAIFNKKKPKKNATHKQRSSKPQSTALAPIGSEPPKFGETPFQPYIPSSTPVFSIDAGKDKASRKQSAVLKAKFDPEREFLKTFKQLTYRHRGWDIWNDFVVMAACALSNPVDKTNYDEREARYLRIIKKYDKQEQQHFPALFAHTVMALELNPEQDFLGSLYIRLGLQDDGRKQHFTPYSVCELMASITMNNVVEQVKRDGFITINDPCCGAGATLIAGVHAARKHLEKIDLNFQNHILVTAQDIDETVALMCYIQLSLLGVAAYIKIGNTITDPMNSADTMENYWFTPMYFSEVWAMRRLVHRMDELIQSNAPKAEKKPFRLLVRLEKNDCRCSLVDLYETVAREAGFALTDNSRFNCAKIRCTGAVQNAVYQFHQEQGRSPEAITMMWLAKGPKADLNEPGYAVEIEDGFVVEGEADEF